MDTEVTRDDQMAANRPAEEFCGHDNAAAIEQILHDSIDGHAKSSDAATAAASLADRFAGTVYFAEKVAGSRSDRRSTFYRPAGDASGAEPVRSTRGHRTPARPWRLPAANRNPKS